MNSIIEEIYECNGYNQNIKPSEEYWEIHDDVGELLDKLNAVLDDGHKKVLNDLYLNCGGLQSALARAHFKEGFKLGLILGSEVFGKE